MKELNKEEKVKRDLQNNNSNRNLLREENNNKREK
jgi:hypothetical protein